MSACRIASSAVLVLALTHCKARDDSASGLRDVATKAHDLGAWSCPAGGQAVKVAFFDADSTLRVSKSGSVSANGPDDVNVLPFAGKKIAELNRGGYLVAVVSNQGGVASGAVSAADAEAALVTTARLVAKLGGTIDYLGMAVADDDERKPKTGMAKRLEQLLQDKCRVGIDLAESFMVGDSGYKRGKDGPHPDGRPADDFSNADRGFAQNLFSAGGEVDAKHFQEPTDYFGWKEYGVYNIENQGELEDFVQTLDARGQAEEAKALREVNGLTPKFRFVHFNIKELHTGKLVDPANDQIATAAKVLRALGPDLLSINEIQYDLPDVPTKTFPGTGKNMQRLVEKIAPADLARWSYNLAPANTGAKAKKLPDGNYAVDPNAPGARELADQENFGTFPGQYSTGFATRFPIEKAYVLTDLKWKDWDQGVDFATLKLPNGEHPKDDFLLFDKNFNDLTVTLGDRSAHVITFHTVPAFGFGGSADFNIARNQAQLEFLEWYLLGRCDGAAAKSAVRRCEAGVKPLGDEPFIAIGDLNVDWGTDSPGAKAIERILKDARVNDWRAENPDWKFRQDPTDKKSHISFLSDGYDLGKIQSELDYFLMSKHFKISHGKVNAPLSWFEEHACKDTRAAAEAAKAEVQVDAQTRVLSVSTRYADDGSRKYCVVSASRAFVEARKASDHLPVHVTFGWR